MILIGFSLKTTFEGTASFSFLLFFWSTAFFVGLFLAFFLALSLASRPAFLATSAQVFLPFSFFVFVPMISRISLMISDCSFLSFAFLNFLRNFSFSSPFNLFNNNWAAGDILLFTFLLRYSFFFLPFDLESGVEAFPSLMILIGFSLKTTFEGTASFCFSLFFWPEAFFFFLAFFSAFFFFRPFFIAFPLAFLACRSMILCIILRYIAFLFLVFAILSLFRSRPFVFLPLILSNNALASGDIVPDFVLALFSAFFSAFFSPFFSAFFLAFSLAMSFFIFLSIFDFSFLFFASFNSLRYFCFLSIFNLFNMFCSLDDIEPDAFFLPLPFFLP